MTESLVCKVCGLAVRKKRRAQKYCSAKCQDVAKKRRRRARTGDAIGGYREAGTDQSESVDPKEVLDTDLGGQPLYSAPSQEVRQGPTPGALQGDDYQLEYYEDGYPKLPACLDRRRVALAEAA